MWLFALGITILSLGCGYAWWVKVRVVWLRQDIFDLRDDLFDAALAIGVINDPAHRDARNHLNAVARVAQYLSIPVIASVVQRGPTGHPLQKTENVQLQGEIDKAMLLSMKRVIRYLLTETLTGMLLVPVARFISMGWVEQRVSELIGSWLVSRSAEQMTHLRGAQ